MQTNSTNKEYYDVSSLIEGDFSRKIWKMDTSHYSILEKFLNKSNENKIKIEKTRENKYKFINPDILNKRDKNGAFASRTIEQYIRILIFYDVVDYKEIENLKLIKWNELIERIINGEINLTIKSIDSESYLLNNLDKIVNSIKGQLKSENKNIREDAIKILSTMEIFLNYKNSDFSNSLSIKTFKEFLSHYDFDIKKSKSGGSGEGYINELKNWIKMYDYSEKLLLSLLGKEQVILDDDQQQPFMSVDFTGYGYLGEYLFNELLNHEGIEHEWISQKDKYAPYDFKSNENYIEVKTATTKRNKISFNLSWNEYIQHQAKKDKYKICYIDGVYNLDIKKVIRFGIGNFKKLINENEIVFKEIEYDELKNYKLSSKGYWVTEK